jgi:hypothetical protein
MQLCLTEGKTNVCIIAWISNILHLHVNKSPPKKIQFFFFLKFSLI